MSTTDCTHKGIGLPGCAICDPMVKAVESAAREDRCANVETALRRADIAREAGWIREDQAEVVLAAEVRRLREVYEAAVKGRQEFRAEVVQLRSTEAGLRQELLEYHEACSEFPILRAKLARVEALPAKWRMCQRGKYALEDSAIAGCADELEEALKET